MALPNFRKNDVSSIYATYIAVVNLGIELDLHGLERVIWGKKNVDVEDAALVRTANRTLNE
jgi:hypothetical protein